MRTRIAGVMTTLMRNGRDRRSGEPASCHAIDKRVLLMGTRSADYIRASGHSGCIQRPNTWLHPNASLKRQIPLATRAPSIRCKVARSSKRASASSTAMWQSRSPELRGWGRIKIFRPAGTGLSASPTPRPATTGGTGVEAKRVGETTTIGRSVPASSRSLLTIVAIYVVEPLRSAPVDRSGTEKWLPATSCG